MKEFDLPVGVELTETEDIHGVPCVELVIQCADKDIALNYYESITKNYQIVQRLKDYLKKNPHDEDTHQLMLNEKWVHYRIKKDILLEGEKE